MNPWHALHAFLLVAQGLVTDARNEAAVEYVSTRTLVLPLTSTNATLVFF